MRITVECRAGYRADEEVKLLRIKDRAVTVEATLDRWAGPGHRYFKVKGEDGGIYIVRQNVDEDYWELTHYRRS